MKLSFKKWFKKTVEDYKKSQTPEEIKKKIEKEKLMRELEEEKAKRRKFKDDNFKLIIGGKEVK